MFYSFYTSQILYFVDQIKKKFSTRYLLPCPPHLQMQPVITNSHGSGNCAPSPCYSQQHSHSHSPSESHYKIKNRIPIPTALHSFIFSFSFFCLQLQRAQAQTRLPRWLGVAKRRRRSHPPNLRRLRLPLRRPLQSRHFRHRPRRRRRQVLILSHFLLLCSINSRMSKKKRRKLNS